MGDDQGQEEREKSKLEQKEGCNAEVGLFQMRWYLRMKAPRGQETWPQGAEKLGPSPGMNQ